MVQIINDSKYRNEGSTVPLNVYRLNNLRELETLFHYYERKYNFATRVVSDISHINYAQLPQQPQLVDLNPILAEIDAIREKYKDVDEIRAPIILGISSGQSERFDLPHGMSFIYLKEKGREGLFINDSIGFGLSKEPFMKAMNQRGLPVYSTFRARQLDVKSCLTDTITTVRDVCRNDSETGYYIPDFLEFLETHSEKIKVLQVTETDDAPTFFNITAFPDKFLKTPQNEQYIKDLRLTGQKNSIFHKDFTLDAFRDRHAREVTVKDIRGRDKHNVNANLYLPYRSLQLTAIVMVATYAEEIVKRFDDKNLYDNFIRYYKENRTQQIPKNAMYIEEAESTYQEIIKIAQAFISKVEEQRLNKETPVQSNIAVTETGADQVAGVEARMQYPTPPGPQSQPSIKLNM